ncbi:acetoacetate decarboxylase family protein [Nocardioides caldifontis]|uniref:acetoacetate decarboxylase family protein n=1 Tax=Nocardioides caldifontis TaxID=2588938 RepID=UPI001396A208|nr:acetoacetate decarboxylase family protein [Nocardioides caldifontis]
MRPRAGGEDGTFILRLPVDGEFTCAAGREVWGFPKSVEELSFDYTDTSLTVALHVGGELVLRLRVPRHGVDHMAPLTNASYTLKDGRLHCTRFTQGGSGAGLALGPEGVELELGEHPWAKELRGLGLPAPAVLSTWNEHMVATFEEALPV